MKKTVNPKRLKLNLSVETLSLRMIDITELSHVNGGAKSRECSNINTYTPTGDC